MVGSKSRRRREGQAQYSALALDGCPAADRPLFPSEILTAEASHCSSAYSVYARFVDMLASSHCESSSVVDLHLPLIARTRHFPVPDAEECAVRQHIDRRLCTHFHVPQLTVVVCIKIVASLPCSGPILVGILFWAVCDCLH